MHTAVSHVTDIHVTEYRRHVVKAVEGGVVTRCPYILLPWCEDQQCSGSAGVEACLLWLPSWHDRLLL